MSDSPALPSQARFDRGFLRRFTARGSHLRATSAYLTDQAVCSAGNFVTSFLAARNLPAAQFGVFALLNILLVFSLTVNNWLIRSSLSKTSQLADPDHVRSYTSTLAGLAAIFGVIPAAILVGASFFLHHSELGLALCIAAIAAQVQETMRRSAMAQSSYQAALLGDSVSYLGQALLLGLAVLTATLSLHRIFWVMSATSVLALMLEARKLHLEWPRAIYNTARSCWEQGRWIVLSGFVLSPIVYGMPWIVEFTRGQAQAGMLSGLVLVLGLSNPIMFSSTWLILARGQASRDTPIGVVLRNILPSLALTALPLLACWALVFSFPNLTLHLFYGDRMPYISLAGTLRLVVIYYLASYAAVCLEVITDIRDKSRTGSSSISPHQFLCFRSASSLRLKRVLSVCSASASLRNWSGRAPMPFCWYDPFRPAPRVSPPPRLAPVSFKWPLRPSPSYYLCTTECLTSKLRLKASSINLLLISIS